MSREATERALIEAVSSLLAEEGFTGVGVNEVCRRAGVNKALLYRYFDGLEGLLAAFARGSVFMPQLEELCEGDLDAVRTLPPRERARRVFLAYVAALRRRPRTIAIMAWEGVARNELTTVLEAQREQLGEQVMRELGLSDAPSFILATASAQYLLIRAQHITVFSGRDLSDPALWEELADRAADLMAAEPRGDAP